MVRSQRKHQGFETPSSLLRNLTTGTTTTRNERDIRKFPGDADQIADAAETSADTENVITGIMKHNECMKGLGNQTADNGEQSGRSTNSISTAHTDSDSHSSFSPETYYSSESTETFEEQVCSLEVPGHIAWAKEIQVIYYQEPQVRSVQKLLHHFANRPRRNEHLEQRQEEAEDEAGEGNQEESDRRRRVGRGRRGFNRGCDAPRGGGETQ